MTKGLSQAAFAALFNLTRASVGAYEEGRAEPKIQNIIDMANYFSISVDLLLKKELTVNELYNFDIFDEVRLEAQPKQKTAKQSDDAAKIPLVPAQQQTDFLVNHQNTDFLQRLPHLYLPLEIDSQLMAFELSNDAMLRHNRGLRKGDLLVCKAVDKASKLLKPGKIYLAQTKDALVLGRLKVNKKSVSLMPDNEFFEAHTVNVEKIVQLWKAMSYVSSHFEDASSLEDRVEEVLKRLG